MRTRVPSRRQPVNSAGPGRRTEGPSGSRRRDHRDGHDLTPAQQAQRHAPADPLRGQQPVQAVDAGELGLVGGQQQVAGAQPGHGPPGRRPSPPSR